MKDKTIKISKVVIDLGDKKIELSLDEAKSLLEILQDTFDAKVVIGSSPTIIERPYYPYPYRTYPWWGVTYTTTTDGTYTINCSATTEGVAV